MIDTDNADGAANATDWPTLDPWWESFVGTHSVGQLEQRASRLDSRFWADIGADTDFWSDASEAAYSLPERSHREATVFQDWEAGHWEHLDTWCAAHRSAYDLPRIDADTATLTGCWTDKQWQTLDSWWQRYDTLRTEAAQALQAELQHSDDRWQRSNSRFDVNPLSTDWRTHQRTRGPLRPNQEENWSQWLAHLLRGADGLLLGELFGGQYSQLPRRVEREAHLPGEESDRYADILVFFGGQGISIEVKKGDEHYEKTTHTATLTEDTHAHDWTHILLLPKYKYPALRGSVKESLSEPDTGRPRIHSDQSGDIDVVFWREVSGAIRSVLLGDVTLPPHWEASAYLFCTLIEQKLLDYNPAPVVSDFVAADGVGTSAGVLRVATGGPKEQISYLQNEEP